MSSITVVTGNFIEAIENLNPEVVVNFMTERGVLWGFSKAMAEEYTEVKNMLNVDHSALIGRWQYAQTFKRTMVMAYISAPEQQRMYQNENVRGLKEALKSIVHAMVADRKRTLMVQYPGMGVCGCDIYGFNLILAEVRAGFDIDIIVPVNPVIGSKYQPQCHVKHYDSKARIKLKNHVNFIEENTDAVFDVNGFNRANQNGFFKDGVYGTMANAFKSAYCKTKHY